MNNLKTFQKLYFFILISFIYLLHFISLCTRFLPTSSRSIFGDVFAARFIFFWMWLSWGCGHRILALIEWFVVHRPSACVRLCIAFNVLPVGQWLLVPLPAFHPPAFPSPGPSCVSSFAVLLTLARVWLKSSHMPLATSRFSAEQLRSE